MTDAPHEEAAGPPDGDRPPQEMRLRSSRAPVTRLSRKVLLGLSTAAAIGIGGALVPGSPAAAPDHRVRALQHQQSHDPGWPRQSAARLYGPAESRSPARPAASRRSRPADRQCRRASARHADTRPGSRAAAHRSGAGGSAHQPSLRDDQRRTGRARGHPGIDRRAGGRARRRLSRSDVAGSQARLPERQCRSSHGQSRSRRTARQSLRAAGRRGDPRGADHGTAFRPAWPGHCPGHRGRLRQPDRTSSPDPARRRA